jgi:hypothetical protein
MSGVDNQAVEDRHAKSPAIGASNTLAPATGDGSLPALWSAAQ